MHKIVVLYPKPTDPDHFRDYYANTHIPLAKELPGLKAIRYSMDVQGLGGESPYFCVAELDFEDAAAMGQALGSEQGKKVAADVGNYATGGVTMVHYDTVE